MQDVVRKIREIPNLRKMGEEAFAEAHTYDRSIKLLARRLRNPKFLTEVCEYAAIQLIRLAADAVRQNSGVSRTGRGSDNPSGLASLSRSRIHDLLDTPLGWSNGIPLGDGTRKELLMEIHGYQKLAKGNAIKAKWMQLIHNKIHGKQRVRTVLDDQKLRELFDKANHET
jgi:hypothetical protein